MERERYIEMMENLRRLADEGVLVSAETSGMSESTVYLFAHCGATMELADELLKMGIKASANMSVNDGRVVSNFIVQALKGEDLTIYGDGTQTRSFCYVDDLVDGMIRMMNSRDGFTGPVNLGNPGEFTMLELAQKAIELTGSKSKIVFKPLPQDDPTQRKPVIDLAKKELDWEPSIQLDEGLAKTIDYFKSVI